jgi:hypothetical protein
MQELSTWTEISDAISIAPSTGGPSARSKKLKASNKYNLLVTIKNTPYRVQMLLFNTEKPSKLYLFYIGIARKCLIY